MCRLVSAFDPESADLVTTSFRYNGPKPINVFSVLCPMTGTVTVHMSHPDSLSQVNTLTQLRNVIFYVFSGEWVQNIGFETFNIRTEGLAILRGGGAPQEKL